MNSFLTLSLIILLGYSEGTSTSNYNGVREKYFAVLKDTDSALELYEKDYEGIKENDALVLAYKGALEALLTKTTWNFIRKISYLKQSKATFDKALKLDSRNVEVRFLRLAVETQIPFYLGYSEHIEEDSKYICSNIDQFNFDDLDPKIQYEILNFFYNCNEFDKMELNKIKNHLAVN